MTRRERVLKAIAHENTDFTPYNIDMTQLAYEKLVQYTGDANYIYTIGNHISGTGYGGFEEFMPGYFRDIFGVIWNRTVDKDIGVIEGYVIPDATLEGFSLPEIDEEKLRKNCEAAIENAGDTCRVFSIGFSMFERAWTLRGMENLLVDMVAEPQFVHNLLDAICDFNCRVLEIALDYPFDGHYFGDDWGQQSGTIMGPNYWREFIKPRIKRMYSMVKNRGKFVAQHSCGDILELFPDLIEIGLDAYQTFQPEIYNVKAVKKEFGNDLTFWGGVSTQRALPFVTPDEVKRIAWDMIRTVGDNGGYIAAPTHAIPGDVPPENIVALVEAFQNQPQR